MCDFFDDFHGEFMDDGYGDVDFDDDMERSADPDFDDELNQEDDQTGGFTWDEAYWSGVGLVFAYEEVKRERRRRKNLDKDDVEI